MIPPELASAFVVDVAATEESATEVEHRVQDPVPPRTRKPDAETRSFVAVAEATQFDSSIRTSVHDIGPSKVMKPLAAVDRVVVVVVTLPPTQVELTFVAVRPFSPAMPIATPRSPFALAVTALRIAYIRTVFTVVVPAEMMPQATELIDVVAEALRADPSASITLSVTDSAPAASVIITPRTAVFVNTDALSVS